jgi:LmbE family N-acetylglucosaminyl deacetylase
MAHTLVCFHAHPDDEALLTAGTVAKAAAAGHRVVLVVATKGEVGEVAGDFLATGEDLGAHRWAELRRSADILGVARLIWLGYADSGLAGPAAAASDSATEPLGAAPVRFVEADLDEASGRLAEILVEERADVLTTYDPNGGYGHPDHVRVHEVGRAAAELAGTPVVLEATIDRELMRTGVELASSLGFEIPPEFTPDVFLMWYTPAEAITHTVDVAAHLEQKRAAMEAHASQATTADPRRSRTLERFLALPPEYFALAFGTEWFVERGRRPGDPADDVFASLVAAP